MNRLKQVSILLTIVKAVISLVLVSGISSAKLKEMEI